MTSSVFVGLQFWLLIAFSIFLPVGVYLKLLFTRAIASGWIAGFGAALLVMACVDVYLLQVLAAQARETASLMDDHIFNSGVSVALYILPAVFGGLGVNMISHVLLRHLALAALQFEKDPGRRD